jgi:signal transduction histidine kinase
MVPAPYPENELERLETLRRYDLLDTLPEQEFDDATALAAFICGTPISLISLVADDRQWFKSRKGLDAEETSREASFCANTLLDGQTLIVEDTLLDERFADNPLVVDGPKIRFYAGAPLVASNGLVLGTVCVIDTHPRTLSEEQKMALEALSRQVMALCESRLLVIRNAKAAAVMLQSEKLSAVGRMASSMAHEINNPLEALTNLVYLARQEATRDDQRLWLDLAEMEVRRITQIARQALRFHRQSSRPLSVRSEELFEPTLAMHESRLRNAGIRVEWRQRARIPVECFDGDIRQVLNNLFVNALDALSSGGRLIVRSREGTDWTTGRKGLVLTIADTGAGIGRAAQLRMFEAFFTTKGIGGSGLGLWISAEIMKRHQGRITIRSSVDTRHQGTVVNLFLPREQSQG